MVQFKLRGIKFQTRLVIKECSVFEELLRKAAIAAYGNQSEVTYCIPYNAFSSIMIIIRNLGGRSVSSVLLRTHVNATPRGFLLSW